MFVAEDHRRLLQRTTECLFFIGGLLNEPLCILRGASLFIGGLLDESLFVLRGASFFIRGILHDVLCVLWGVSFFVGGLLNERFAFYGVLPFSSEVF
jgi:hypothetical protein